jgi:hypothetical protein
LCRPLRPSRWRPARVRTCACMRCVSFGPTERVPCRAMYAGSWPASKAVACEELPDPTSAVLQRCLAGFAQGSGCNAACPQSAQAHRVHYAVRTVRSRPRTRETVVLAGTPSDRDVDDSASLPCAGCAQGSARRPIGIQVADIEHGCTPRLVGAWTVAQACPLIAVERGVATSAIGRAAPVHSPSLRRGSRTRLVLRGEIRSPRIP